jgi:hypothetical protein
MPCTTVEKGQTNGTWNRIKSFKITTLNSFSLLRIGACQNFVEVLARYNIIIAALQEVRWSDIIQVRVADKTIFYLELDNRHIFGTGFAIHNKIIESII